MERKTRMIVVVGLLVGTWSIAAAEEQDRWNDPRGPGITFWSRNMGIVAEDLEDYLEDAGYENLEALTSVGATLYWSFTPGLSLGLETGAGDTGYQGLRSTYHPEEDLFTEARLRLSYSNLVIHYRRFLAERRWVLRLGGGVGLYAMNLDLERTIGEGGTHVERYEASGVGAQLDGAVQYNLSRLFGIFLAIGGTTTWMDELERGGDVAEEMPDPDFQTLFLGFGLSIHV